MLGLGMGLGLSAPRNIIAAVQTTLRREANGTVSVLTLGASKTPTLTRQPDGSVSVGG